MKKIKKGLSLLLAIMMFVAMVVPTFANEIKGTIIIQNDSTKTGISMKGHTYSLYKVFDVTIKPKQLSAGMDTEKYAYSVDKTQFRNFFIAEAAKDEVVVDTAQKLNEYAVKYVQEHGDPDSNLTMEQLTKKLKNYIETTGVTAEKTSDEAVQEKVVIGELDLGYYIILDNGTNPKDEKTVIAAAALGTTGLDENNEYKLTVNLKGSAPTIDKDFTDGSNGAGNQIGDSVEFKLTSKVPSNLTGYDTYVYRIRDKMSEGLTFEGEVKILIEGKEEPLEGTYYQVTHYTNSKCNCKDREGNPLEHTLHIDIDILKAIKEGALKEGDTLYTYYSATLNENAVIAGEANTNKVDLEYSNNPYEDSTNTTPEVEVKDYTFKINGLKTNESKEALEGAQFELSTVDGPIYFKLATLEDGTNQYIVCTGEHDHENSSKICTKTIVSGANGRFEIIGLDDNVKYTLTETQAPDGYNPIDPIEFEITATYDKEGNITDITATDGSGIVKLDGTFELGTTIVNVSGSKLPETGGIGTTLFKVIGSIMMIGSAVLLITKRRLGGQEK